MKILAIPLGWLMKGCYMLVKNYGVALLLFTIVTRLITLPIQIKQQKSTARMNLIQPELEKLKKKYGKNQDKLNEEMMKLYSENQINPMASCLPMVITLVLLWALIPVVYGPLTYISSADKDVVSKDNALVKNLYTVSVAVDGNDTDIAAIIDGLEAKEGEEQTEELVKTLFDDEENYKNLNKMKLTDDEKKTVASKFIDYEGLDKFLTNENYFSKNMMASSYGPELLLFNFQTKEDGKYFSLLDTDVQNAISDFDYTFFGMELSKMPTTKDSSVIIPVLSFLLQVGSMIISQIFMRKNNPETKMNMSMMLPLFLMPIFSLYIGFRFPCAMGIYWIYSSAFAVLQVIFLNIVYSPAKLKVIAEKEAEKAKAKRKNKGPSFMERAIEIRNEQGPNMPDKNSVKKRVYADDDDGEGEVSDVKLSKAQMKEQNRQKLNEARKRYAEKYGDEYTED